MTYRQRSLVATVLGLTSYVAILGAAFAYGTIRAALDRPCSSSCAPEPSFLVRGFERAGIVTVCALVLAITAVFAIHHVAERGFAPRDDRFRLALWTVPLVPVAFLIIDGFARPLGEPWISTIRLVALVAHPLSVSMALSGGTPPGRDVPWVRRPDLFAAEVGSRVS